MAAKQHASFPACFQLCNRRAKKVRPAKGVWTQLPPDKGFFAAAKRKALDLRASFFSGVHRWCRTLFFFEERLQQRERAEVQPYLLHVRGPATQHLGVYG